VQVGADVARLNMGGWNVHLGTTAGYLAARSREEFGPGAFRTNFEVPFLGTYLVATMGGFFADAMVRGEFYNIELNEPALNLHGQPFAARGFSVSTSAGYHWQLQNNWFIEPSAGFIWSRTKVDPFNTVGLPAPQPGAELSGTSFFEDIESKIGRLSLRVGTSFLSGNLVLQPFASASVFREFADDVRSTFVTCPDCVFVGLTPVTDTFVTDTSRVGTYFQFSAGLAGQVTNTGWVGFVRGDYRVGDNIEGWTANAGLRYQFTPELIAAPVGKGVVTKAPPLPVVAPVNWTGFYVGGFLGAAYGRSDFRFVDDGQVKPWIGGVVGGGQAGFNYQINQVVLGVEGDFGAANINGSRACGTNTGITLGDGVVNAFSPFFLTCTSDLDWIATFAGRIGYAWDRSLFYVKGGGAWTEENHAVGCILGPNNGNPLNARACRNPAGALTNGFSASEDNWGWMVGYGVEFALTQNWSAKAEYNYIDFGRDTVAATDGTLLNAGTHVSVAKIGVNYRFTGLPLAR
jgi:opacity protein-like surface antigen